MVRFIVVLVLAALVAGCSITGKGSTKSTPGAMVLEVERFTITKGEIKTVKDASGGKAVQFTDEAGQAELAVPLAAGKYELTVYALGKSADEDAFFVRIANATEERCFLSEYGKVVPAQTLPFTVEKDGPCRILINFGEENVLLDRVEIKPVK